MGYGNSNGDGMASSSKVIIGGIIFFAALIIVPSMLTALTGIRMGMEPFDYATQSQKGSDGVACNEFSPATQSQELKECRAVATFGMEGATMIRQLIDALIWILGVVGALLIIVGVVMRIRG